LLALFKYQEKAGALQVAVSWLEAITVLCENALTPPASDNTAVLAAIAEIVKKKLEEIQGTTPVLSPHVREKGEETYRGENKCFSCCRERKHKGAYRQACETTGKYYEMFNDLHVKSKGNQESEANPLAPEACVRKPDVYLRPGFLEMIRVRDAVQAEDKELEQNRISRRTKKVTPHNLVKFEESDKVEGDYKGTGKYYPGKISRCRLNGTYDINYDDGERETGVEAEMIRSLAEKFEESDKVEGNYKGKGKYYPGKISRCRVDGTYDINYDDGERESGVEAEMIRSRDGGGGGGGGGGRGRAEKFEESD
jgi:hypothetical protein